VNCVIDKNCVWRCRDAEEHERLSPSQPELDYAEAKREARSILGVNADVELVTDAKLPFFPARVGVWQGRKFLMVGAGQTYRAALDDAKRAVKEDR
jgi:hypothetical protein